MALPGVSPDGAIGPNLTIDPPRDGDTIALNSPVILKTASVEPI
jgi:hypothetical protein